MVLKPIPAFISHLLRTAAAILFGLLVTGMQDAMAATCTSQSSGNWNVAARWSCAGTARVPLTTDTAVIASAHTVTLNISDIVQQVTVNGTLNTDNNNRVLTLNTTTTATTPLFVMGPTGTFTPGNSTVVMSPFLDVTLTSGAITFNNLQLTPTFTSNNNRTYTFGSEAITVNGDFTINPFKSGGGTRTLTVDMGAPITVAGTTTITGSGGRAKAVLETTAGNHALTSGRLTISANGTLTANASTITLNGSTGPLFTFAGTFNEDTSTVIMNSPASVTLNSGSPAFAHLVINMAGQTGTLGASIHVQNTLSIVAGTLNDGGSQITSGAGPRSMTMATGTNLILGSTSAASAFPTGFLTAEISLAAGSTVTYNSNAGQTISHIPVYANLNLVATAAVVKTPSGALDIDGSLTIGANNSLAGMSFNHALAGNFTNNGTLFGNTSTFTFDGSAAQTIGGTSATTFNSLTIDNISGVMLSQNVTVGSVLTLTNGILSVGSNRVIVTSNCTTGIVRTNGFVDGKLRLTFPNANNVSCTYHVGGNGFYAPIGIVMNSTGGTLTGSTTSTEHPEVQTSGINSAKNVNRYWSLRDTGDTFTLSTSTTYAATFNFPSSDVDAGALWNQFVAARYTAGAWTKFTDVTASVTATGVSTITGGILATTDFVVGEDSDPCPVPAGFMTCACDNFGRTTLNPSTIFNSDWITTRSGGGFDAGIVANHLRMTDSTNNVATAATVPGTFPAAGNNITVEFLHYAYKNTTGAGADGIALTLSDSSVSPTAGAFGGSLGYAQKCEQGTPGCTSDCTTPGGCPGFNGGWLGVGIDEWGNFSNPTEGRVGGSAQIAQSVTLRGSGSGAGSGAGNYPFLATSGTLTPAVDFPNTATRERGHRYRITVDARCYEANNAEAGCNNPTLERQALVKVERDTTGTGDSYQTLPNLNLTNIYSFNTIQQDVPENWKLSFTGSTGGAVNIHELKGLKICSTAFTAPGSFDIQANSSSGLTCATPGGTPSSPMITISARNNQNVLDTGYVGTVTLSAKLSNGTLPATATWRKVGTGTNIANGGTYTFVAGDNGSAQFYLTSTSAGSLTVTISDASASTTSSTPIVYSSTAASFTIEDAEPAIGAVAGRPHLMKVTYFTGCGTTVVAGSKDMSGWFQPDGEHPAGAAGPRMCPAPAGAPTSCLPDASPQTCGNAQLTTAAPATSNLTLDFNGSSSAYFCLKSTDVGKYYPQLRETAAPTATTSSSPLMTVRPFAVVVTDIKSGAVDNPAGNDAAASANGGAAFTSAGTDFEATVGGYLWNSAGDANGDGIPDAAANRGQVTGSGTAGSFADTVLLSAAAPFGPSAGSVGLLNDNDVVVTGGIATKSTLDYAEVGAFTLVATPSASYLGVSLTDRVVIFSNSGNTAARNSVVGRFKPHYFDVTAATFVHGCDSGSFTYQAQPFRIGFTLRAMNLRNQVTGNYGVTGYAPAATGNVLSLVAENSNDGTNHGARIAEFAPTPALGVPAWTDGQFLFPPLLTPDQNQFTFGRAVNAEAPFASLALGLRINDADDGVPMQGDMDAGSSGVESVGFCATATCAAKLGTTDMRYGRLKIDNAYGSELLPLRVNVEAQHWNGTHYVRNTDDSCTQLLAGNFQMSGQTGNNGVKVGINATNMNITANFGVATPLVAGMGAIRLARPATPPAVTIKGSVDLQSVMPHLPGTGRETFGVYKSGPVIYIREMY